MNLRDFIKTIADSDVADWELILQPTYRHRFTPVIGPEGEQLSLETDQHRTACPLPTARTFGFPWPMG